MRKMEYIGLELEVIKLGAADVIVTSNPDGEHPGHETPETEIVW